MYSCLQISDFVTFARHEIPSWEAFVVDGTRVRPAINRIRNRATRRQGRCLMKPPRTLVRFISSIRLD